MNAAASMRIPVILCALVAACTGGAPDASDPVDAERRGRAIIDRAIREGGTTNNIAHRRPFAISGTGTIDKAAQGQSFTPLQPSPGPFRERLVFDLVGSRISREYREDLYDGTFAHITELHGADTIQTILVHTHGIAAPQWSPGNPAAKRAVLRRLPHTLLAEVSREGATPRWLGSDDHADSVAALLQSGTPVTLTFDPADGLLRALSYDTVIAARGRVTLAWSWTDWRTVPDIGRFPFRYAATVNGQPFIDVFVDSIALANDADFSVPASLRGVPVQYDSGAARPSLEFQSVANGVFLVPGVRAGFAPLVIERAADLVVIDAPASFPLLGSIPLSHTDPGPHPDWVSEQFVDAIRQRFPAKPVGYVILTHGHEDHAGGIRAFVAESTAVVAHPALRSFVQTLLRAPAHASSDQLPPLRFIEVRDSLHLVDPLRPIHILTIDPNPHAVGLLAIHLPRSNILFVSDLITPAALDVYPRAAHAPLDLAFLRWFDTRAFDNPRILSMHGSAELTRDHLQKLRRLAAQSDSTSEN